MMLHLSLLVMELESKFNEDISTSISNKLYFLGMKRWIFWKILNIYFLTDQLQVHWKMEL